MSVGPEMTRLIALIGEVEQHVRDVLARGDANSEEIQLLKAQVEEAIARLAQLHDELHL